MEIYRFRDCLLHTGERSVIKDRKHLSLTTKTFDVLQFLIDNRGRVVTKDEILGTVWNGSIVEESNLPVHISKLRKCLDETKNNRFIETVQGSGYRFLASVQRASEMEWRESCDRSSLESVSAAESIHSIAVLPLSVDPPHVNHDYLADGLTEELINRLSNVRGFKVIARNTVFRYKGKEVEMTEIGDLLGVANVLTGRIRIVGDDVIVGVELIRTDDGLQIWGGQYQRSVTDLVRIQEEISFAIAEKLAPSNVSRKGLLAKSLTREPESYRLYLKGRFYLEKHSGEDMYRAIDFFNKSLAIDSKNIYSYVEIVECYRSLYAYGYISYEDFLRITKPIAVTVAAGDQELDVVQVMHCDLNMLEWKFDEAAHYCRKALALNPNCLKGRLRYSDLLLQSRNFGDALAQLEWVMIIDPLSPLIYKRIGRLFYIMGEYENAIAYLDDALELEPCSYEALSLRGVVRMETGKYAHALRDFEEALRAENHPEIIALRGVVHAKLGRPEEAYKAIKQIETTSNRPGNSVNLAHVHFVLSNKERTYELLETAYEHHEADLRALTYDRRWLPLRHEARFRELVQRVGLPDLDS